MSEENRVMTKSREGPASTFNGYLFLLLLFAAIALGVWRVIEFNIGGPTALGGMLFGLAIFLFVFFIAGFFMIQPNQAVNPVGDPLFEALRELRRELAAEAQLPPYVIFHDATLAQIADGRPESLDDLAGISGVGGVKLERYGERVLATLRADADGATLPSS